MWVALPLAQVVFKAAIQGCQVKAMQMSATVVAVALRRMAPVRFMAAARAIRWEAAISAVSQSMAAAVVVE